ncbi:hypothetical protein NPIL_532961 [Nephila pilipes]|uniref:Uncharacterized protein n=1 Tax=Nephila pilipes TaxID=299642 RepID=A0A8X6P248_NEPPI|nr:hypothetical protein NPIL_532961 [Nephila pilipes]
MTSEVVHESVSIPDVVAIIKTLNTAEQCLKADGRINEYLAAIPLTTFNNTEDQTNYKSELLSGGSTPKVCPDQTRGISS